MEIKYEAVFGDQSLFDSTVGTINEDALIVLARNDYKVFFQNIEDAFSWMQKDESYRSKCICSYAMRRIIRTPTWTVADRDAGRLPEVGCDVINTDCSISMYVLCKVIYVDKDVVVVYNGELSQTHSHIAFLTAFKPIESPEEKAARLEDEWVDAAYGNTLVFACVTKDENDRLKQHLRAIYKAQISGDLPVPVKGE